jgi:hypothetical protein
MPLSPHFALPFLPRDATARTRETTNLPAVRDRVEEGCTPTAQPSQGSRPSFAPGIALLSLPPAATAAAASLVRVASLAGQTVLARSRIATAFPCPGALGLRGRSRGAKQSAGRLPAPLSLLFAAWPMPSPGGFRVARGDGPAGKPAAAVVAVADRRRSAPVRLPSPRRRAPLVAGIPALAPLDAPRRRCMVFGVTAKAAP